MSINRTASGQALTEGVLLLPLLILVVFTIIWFLRLLVTRQQLVMAARYGTDMIYSTPLNEAQIRREVRNYLAHPWISGRRLDPDKLTDDHLRVAIRDFRLPDLSLFEHLDPGALEGTMRGLLTPVNDTSFVEISYDLAIPRCISFISGSETFTVRARSEVLAGSGCRDRIHRRNK